MIKIIFAIWLLSLVVSFAAEDELAQKNTSLPLTKPKNKQQETIQLDEEFNTYQYALNSNISTDYFPGQGGDFLRYSNLQTKLEDLVPYWLDFP